MNIHNIQAILPSEISPSTISDMSTTDVKVPLENKAVENTKNIDKDLYNNKKNYEKNDGKKIFKTLKNRYLFIAEYVYSTSVYAYMYLYIYLYTNLHIFIYTLIYA
jgi:hypothetical protein